MSEFWSWFIIVLTLGMLFFVTWLLMAYRTTNDKDVKKDSDSTPQLKGHSYDGIEEYDNPLPSWWFWLFMLTIIFSLVYLLLYPGLGNFKGFLGWTSEGQYQEEVKQAEKLYGPIFERYGSMPIEKLLDEPGALKMGQRIFANNCSTCHGSNATGSRGFPNLVDHDWLYGGKPDNIKTSITQGRQAAMPGWGAIVGEDAVVNLAAYVRGISGLSVDSNSAELGKVTYQTMCIACHGPEGKGIQALGGPNLTDPTWLYGSSKAQVEESIRVGRTGEMPAFSQQLNEHQIHIVSAYVYSLSRASN